MDKITIAVILGTKRDGRMSEHAAKLVANVGETFEEAEIIFVDPLDFDLPKDGVVKDSEYAEITKKADAFFIVTPEYNHGYPGSLKRLLDSQYPTYNYKPVAFAGVSKGPWGGTRVIEALIPVTKTMKMIPINPDVNFTMINETFDNQGNILQKEDEYRNKIRTTYKELIWMAKVLKTGMKNVGK